MGGPLGHFWGSSPFPIPGAVRKMICCPSPSFAPPNQADLHNPQILGPEIPSGCILHPILPYGVPRTLSQVVASPGSEELLPFKPTPSVWPWGAGLKSHPGFILHLILPTSRAGTIPGVALPGW